MNVNNVHSIVRIETGQNIFRMKEINKLKRGDLFKVKEGAKDVYLYDGYNRSTGKYSAFKFDDINSFREFKKGTQVFINFEF